MADGPRPKRNHVSEYSCFYCAEQTDDLQTCVEHLVEYHGDTVLKLRTKIFNERSGKFGLVTKNFNIVPSNVLQFGQWLQINESDWTIVVKEQENVSCENMELEEMNDFMFEDKSARYTDEENECECISLETSMHNLTIDSVHSTFPKKSKCSTPFKEHIVQPEELFKRTESQSQNVPLDKMITMMPSLLEHMKINGHLETWLILNKMIADGRFPFENISFLLFMDVCRFLTSENISAMKYNETVKRFWRIGYRLFHGKWLKFMIGPQRSYITL